MTPEELRVELAAGTLRNAYLVVGEEPLLRDDAVAALRGAVLEPGADAFNFDRLEGDATTPGALIDAVRTLPVMASHRMVVLRDPEGSGRKRSGLTETIAELVSELNDDPDGPTAFVVVASKADRRSRWVKAFGANAVIGCDPPRGSRDLTAFARAEAKRQGVGFEKGALELLVERIGPQLLMLRQEIAKAELLAGKGNRVTRTHVADGASDIAEESIWDLTDAIGEGRGPAALESLTRQLADGAAPPAMLGALVTHFRKLLRVRSGGSVPGPPFVLKKLERQAGRYTPGRLLNCLGAIHETDTALKGQGALSPEMALERLVIGLAS
jgi:DNA polymerase-3 subunit delta